MRSYSYINSAKAILTNYHGAIPFAAWLKNYFKEYKKFGSKDRKVIAHLCFCYFRLGNAFANLPVEEKILIGQLLCSDQATIVLEELKPEWKEYIHLSIEEKLKLLNAQQELQSVFPFHKLLSDAIDANAFAIACLIQPDLFLRIRPGRQKSVLQKLSVANFTFIQESEDAIRLPNNSKMEEILKIDEEVVVQDLSSQKVLNALQLQITGDKLPTTIWDCCAASGGKSILAFDKLKNSHLTVSDVRESILINLKKRFERAGIKNYRSFVADLSTSNFKFQISNFDLVICDAPCSGSGTWSRTPEQLHFFKREKVDDYANLQKKISLNASKYVKPGGYFLYITCSVFKKENEEVVSYLQKVSSLQLFSSDYYKGYNQKADTLFAALFKA